MNKHPSVICIGSALWDTIARAENPLHGGADVPGRIDRQLGGVALNVALALADRDVSVAILSAVGNDADGDALLVAAEARGVDCSYVTRGNFPTDNYNAIEAPNGELFAAVADCHSLERAGSTILEPLRDGSLASAQAPYPGTIIVDGNLSTDTLADFAVQKDGCAAFLVFIPASPGKAARLKDSLTTCGGTLFANRIEAEILCDCTFRGSAEAATAILQVGANAVITDSAKPASWADGQDIRTATPPDVTVTSVTGAGDAFLAGFIAAEVAGRPHDDWLQAGIDAAATHISRDLSK